jgi:hypothetical protein
MTFKHLEGDTAVIKANGVYKTCDLYTYSDRLFASFGGGYAQLNADGSTSKDKVQIEALALDRTLFKDAFGRLFLSAGKGRKEALVQTPTTMLEKQ